MRRVCFFILFFYVLSTFSVIDAQSQIPEIEFLTCDEIVYTLDTYDESISCELYNPTSYSEIVSITMSHTENLDVDYSLFAYESVYFEPFERKIVDIEIDNAYGMIGTYIMNLEAVVETYNGAPNPNPQMGNDSIQFTYVIASKFTYDWNMNRLDINGYAGTQSSISLDSDGFYHISYTEGQFKEESNLKYATYFHPNVDTGSFSSSSVSDGGNVLRGHGGTDSSLDVVNNKIHISFLTQDSNGLLYATKNRGDDLFVTKQIYLSDDESLNGVGTSIKIRNYVNATGVSIDEVHIFFTDRNNLYHVMFDSVKV